MFFLHSINGFGIFSPDIDTSVQFDPTKEELDETFDQCSIMDPQILNGENSIANENDSQHSGKMTASAYSLLPDAR